MSRKVVNFAVERDELTAFVINEDGTEHTVYIDLIRDEAAREFASKLTAKIVSKIDTAGEDNCAKCIGACCMKAAFQIVEVTADDVARLANHLTITPAEVVAKYIEPMVSSGDVTGSLRFKDESKALGGGCCTFLNVAKDGVGRCSLYDARPRACRQWPAYNCDKFVPPERLRRGLLTHRQWF